MKKEKKQILKKSTKKTIEYVKHLIKLQLFLIRSVIKENGRKELGNKHLKKWDKSLQIIN